MFGNPMRMRDESEREAVIKYYRMWLWASIKNQSITKEMLLSFDGKRLACFCHPKPCHGDVLVKAVEWAKKCVDKG